MAKRIHTLKGPVEIDTLGLILPHEHLFTDLRGPNVHDYARAEPSSVITVLEPYLVEAYTAGVTALVECSTVGVGRNLALLRSLADHTPIHIIAPTGVYRDAYIPQAMREMNEDELAELWTNELTVGIEGMPVSAGFIKLAMSDDGPTALEIRNLQAAAKASRNTGAVIASHTIGGRIAKEEMDVLEEAGLDLHRFIWIHAQTEPNVAILREAASRGAYVELDAIGAPYQSQADMLEAAVALVEAGFVDHLLLSHDAGWYDPARADGLPQGGFRGYTALTSEFIPELLKRGIAEEQVRLITMINPAEALAF
ncbi:MAG TPA: esterase [Anaerolineales bacterium]|nr:esterase [Anaerolineales bacterium]